MKKHRRPIAHEVAEASRALQSEIVQTRSTNELLATARTLARLQVRRARLRKELKRLDKAIKHEQKMLRAVAGALK